MAFIFGWAVKCHWQCLFLTVVLSCPFSQLLSVITALMCSINLLNHMCYSHQSHEQSISASQAQRHACNAGGQWLPDMKELAGGRDDWQQPGDAPERITWEAIRRYAPEVLLLCPCSSNLERSLGEVCSLAAQPGWWALPAVKAGRVFICDHSLFSRPGPRSATHPQLCNVHLSVCDSTC